MGNIHKLLTNKSTPRLSETKYIQRRDDESGIFQMSYAGSGSFTLSLEGRADEDAPWYKVEEFTEASSDDHNDLASDTTIASVVVIFPQMRANLSAALNGPSVSCWLVE